MSELVQEYFYNKVDTSPIFALAAHMLSNTFDPGINIQGPEERSNKCQRLVGALCHSVEPTYHLHVIDSFK